MLEFQRMSKAGMPFSCKWAFFLSAFIAGIVLFTTGCNRPPLIPDVDFAEKYLKEQTYNHCMRYQRLGTVYNTGQDGQYVFFSNPETINYGGLKIKKSRKNTDFNCMFRRYSSVGQTYHKLVNFQVTPLVKTESDKYTYTATMKIEFTCMDKMYQDDSEYNAGMIWLYETSKYSDFSKLDLRNQFEAFWKPDYDFLLLTKRMRKDTTAEKVMVHEVSLRYDAENLSWQWRNSNGKWLDDFGGVTKLDELPQLPNADLLDTDIVKYVSPDVTINNKLMILEYAAYLCDTEHTASLTHFLNDKFLFFCPGQNNPMWLEQEQYKASKGLLKLANSIMIEQQKVSPWQALQALNKHYLAVAPLQGIVWNRFEKDLKVILDMLCDTDFIEKEKKEAYLNKFIQRLGECSNLKSNPHYNNTLSLCTERLKKLRAASGKCD